MSSLTSKVAGIEETMPEMVAELTQLKSGAKDSPTANAEVKELQEQVRAQHADILELVSCIEATSYDVTILTRE